MFCFAVHLIAATAVSLQLDFWYDNSLISRDIFEGLQKCDMKTGALWRTDGPSGFNAECEKLRDKALAQIGDIDQVCVCTQQHVTPSVM